MTSRVQTTAPQQDTSSSPHLANVVQRACACGGSAGLADSCASCSANDLAGTRVQAKLVVGPVNDPYEQEADRVADHVMRMPDTEAATTSEKDPGPVIQRLCSGCEEEEQVQRQAEEEEDQSIQGKRDGGPTGEVSAKQTSEIESIKGGGEPLRPSSRNFFEQRFGHDFSSVRIHSDDRAAHSAKGIHALAYTTGQHIVFGAGHYSPETHAGQKLLAHELTHVIQQGGEQIRRQEDPQSEQQDEPGSPAIIYPPMQLPPGLSIQPTSGSTGEGEGEPTPPAEEEAAVSRLPSSDAANTASPEQQAVSESPYSTGMSPDQLRSNFGSGQALDASVRASYESRYGHSLAHVRVHTDRNADSLCERFGAEAFTYDNHIAFREKTYSPHTAGGENILRHELTHVLRSPASPSTIFRVTPACPTNCPAAAAPAFAPFTTTAVNCYGYAKTVPGSGFLAPGQLAGTADFTAQNTVRGNVSATPAQLAGILPYFTPTGVKTNTEADLGARISSDCSKCCTDPRRKIIEVCSDAATGFSPAFSSGGTFLAWLPKVSASLVWDFHWYRKDADRSWSHKHGSGPAQQNDESGAVPICNPCTADRNFTIGSVNYNNVIGSWCV